MFFPDIDTKFGKKILAKIIKKVYLTNNLVIKLLISIDIIIPENINIIIFKKSRYIRSYSTNIPVKVS
jgi:hypothetical protein